MPPPRWCCVVITEGWGPNAAGKRLKEQEFGRGSRGMEGRWWLLQPLSQPGDSGPAVRPVPWLSLHTGKVTFGNVGFPATSFLVCGAGQSQSRELFPPHNRDLSVSALSVNFVGLNQVLKRVIDFEKMKCPSELSWGADPVKFSLWLFALSPSSFSCLLSSLSLSCSLLSYPHPSLPPPSLPAPSLSSQSLLLLSNSL